MKTGTRVYVIAEAGVNHNGSVDRALNMVEVASQIGADAVKFQTFRAEKLVTLATTKAAYQKQTTDAGESQLAMLQRLELDFPAHQRLKQECDGCGIEFLSTPFDVECVDLLVSLGVERLKISSGDLTNGPLLAAAVSTGLPILLSTGMASLADVEDALGVLAFFSLRREGPSRSRFRAAWADPAGRRALADRITLLHCTTEYPAPLGEVNLRCIETIRRAFGLPVGYSDHTDGSTVAVAAVALGATVIEKHFTLHRNLPGPDHAASLDPEAWCQMAREIRMTEEALGHALKVPGAAEIRNIGAARKSLVALCPIRRGEKFSRENLGCKRPGTGVPALEFWDWLGRHADRDYRADDLISR